MQALPRRGEGDVQILGFTVAARYREADIDPAIPAFFEPWVQALLISRLFGRTAQHADGSLRRLNRSRCPGRDHHIVAACGHGPDHRLAPAQTNVQVARRSDRLDHIKLHRDITRIVRLDHQFFAIGLGNRPGQAIAVLQRDLIG